MDNDPNNPVTTPPETPTPTSFLHAPVSRHNVAIVLAFTILIIAGVVTVAHLSTPKETPSPLSEDNPPSASTTADTPRVYTMEELQSAMDAPTSTEPATVYTEEELRGAMDTPLPPESVRVYTEEELRQAME